MEEGAIGRLDCQRGLEHFRRSGYRIYGSLKPFLKYRLRGKKLWFSKGYRVTHIWRV